MSQRKGKPKTPRRRVAILVHTASDWTRGVLHGVSTYIRETTDQWDVFLEPRGFHEQLSLPSSFSWDGVILRTTHAKLSNEVRKRNVPAVNVSWMGRHSPAIPKVVSDERGCAVLGIEHLKDNGYSNIAYLGPDPKLDYSDTIRRVFKNHDVPNRHFLPPIDGKARRSPSVTQWLKKLPKPVGIVAWNAAESKRILDATMELGLHVPHDVGIVCIEHDHLIASMSQTPLTSIDQDPLTVGYEAARLLESLMQGGDSPDEPILVRPQGVIARQSTVTATTSDAVVRSALEFIQSNFAKPIRVGDICAKLNVSRRQLEHRFRQAINSTPANEIRKTRLANVKRLLVETSLGLDKIAVMSGYDYSEVMTRAFKKEFGNTPGEFRKRR